MIISVSHGRIQVNDCDLPEKGESIGETEDVLPFDKFGAAARAGDRLRARARRSGGGRSVFFSSCEVLDQEGRVIGSGEGVFKYIAGHR